MATLPQRGVSPSVYKALHPINTYYKPTPSTSSLVKSVDANGNIHYTKPAPLVKPAPAVKPEVAAPVPPAPPKVKPKAPVATAQNSGKVIKSTTAPTSAVANTQYSAPDYEALDQAQLQSDYNSGLSSVNPSAVASSAVASQLASPQPSWANPDMQMQQSSFANPDYDKFVSNGGNADSTGSSFGSNWLYRDVANMPDNIKNADPLVQAEWLKSPTAFQSGLSALGTGVSALSGLYGMYQAKQNYNLQKQQQDAVLAQARASEANRSAIAKAFGSSYTPAQF